MSTPERKICWRVTRFCNLACLHCMAGHGNIKHSELTRTERIQVAEVIAAVGLDRITWTGGEPTLCSELPELLRIMQGAGIHNTITTNGLSLRNPLLSVLDREKDCLRFSFDGLRDMHNNIRNANIFDRTLSELIRMQTLGFVIEANISAMTRNIDDLPELTRFLAGIGVKNIVVIVLIHRESAIDHHLESLSREQLKHMTALLFETLKPFPNVGLRINDYTQEDDSYVILESDGDIVLSSELVPDRSYGLIHHHGGTQRLRAAIAEQSLRHQKIIKKIPEV